MSLDAAIAAVRAVSSDEANGPRATRGRVIASVERSPRRRLHAVVAAVIASMFGASAFAWYGKPVQPVRLVAIAEAPVLAPSDDPVEPEPPAARWHVAPVENPPAVDPPVVENPAVVEPTAPVTAPSAALTAPSAAPIEAPASPDPELALYAEAHRLHFQTRDLIAALDAWNRYLAAAPAGKLAPEARFNRLVALVKLERWDDAARELDALGDSTFRTDDLAKLRAVIESRRSRR